jgi:hypothetical protein
VLWPTSSPTGHTVEVTTRAKWVVTLSDHVAIRGFTMKHAGNDAQTSAISSNGYSDWKLENCVLSDAHGAVAALDGGGSNQLLSNDISRGGQLGVHGADDTNDVVRGNKIHDNNIAGFNSDWEAGGLKFAVARNLTLDGNEVYRNDGPGLWCDIGCFNATFSNNRVHHNQQAGIMFEISNGARIHANSTWENGWGKSVWGWGAGILISSSANAEVYNNTVAWNSSGVSVISQNRGVEVKGNYVHNNSIVMDKIDATALGWYQDWPGGMYAPNSGNRGANNSYSYPITENGYWRFTWNNYTSYLTEFNTTAGERNGTYMTDEQRAQLLSQDRLPVISETHSGS